MTRKLSIVESDPFPTLRRFEEAPANGAAVMVLANDPKVASRDAIHRTAAMLDESVRICHEADAKAAEGIVVLGRELAKIRDEQLYKLRIGPDGVLPVHKTWSAFVAAELRMHKATADKLIAVVERFPAEDVVRFGLSKMGLLAQASEEDKPKVREMIEGGASKRDVEAVVRKPKDPAVESARAEERRALYEEQEKASAARIKDRNEKIAEGPKVAIVALPLAYEHVFLLSPGHTFSWCEESEGDGEYLVTHMLEVVPSKTKSIRLKYRRLVAFSVVEDDEEEGGE